MTARQLARALRRAHARSASKQARYESAARAVLRDLLRTAASRFERSVTVFLTAAGDGPGWTPPADDELLSLDEIVGRYRGQTDPIRQSAVADFFAIFGAAAEASGVKANWSTSNPMIAAYLERAGSQITNVAETTRQNVRGIILRSYQDGLSVPDTASAIRAYADSISASRAALIARTEFVGLTRGASLEATQIVSQETGDTYLKRWMTAPGAEYPRHEDYEGLDGQTVALDGLFDVGGEQLAYPGDPDGDPGEVCNCRCDLEYVEASADAVAEGEAMAMPTVGQIDLTNVPQLGGGMNVNEVFGPIRIGDGEFVVKPEPTPENVLTLRRTITAGQDIEREDAAYRVSRWIDRLAPDLGVNTPRFAAGTVRRPETYFDDVVGRTFPAESGGTETVRAGISEFVPDAVPALDHEGGPLAVYEEDLRKGAFYDALIGNLDRHEMNYLIDGDDRMWLIDHGLSFPEENFGAPENGVLYNTAVERFADESGLLDLSDDERSFLSAIQGRRAEVEADLSAAGLPQSARDAFWERVSHMLRYHVVSYGPG